MATIPEQPRTPLRWIGSSLKDLKSFPDDVKEDVGYARHQAQSGEKSASNARRRRLMRRSEILSSSGNVFADLELRAPEELEAKAVLMSKVAAVLTARRLSQTQAAKLLGIDQPRVSALMNGKMSMFSTEKLMEFLTELGNDVDIVIRKKRSRSKGRGRIQVVTSASA